MVVPGPFLRVQHNSHFPENRLASTVKMREKVRQASGRCYRKSLVSKPGTRFWLIFVGSVSGSPTSPSRTFSLVQQAIEFAGAVPEKISSQPNQSRRT